MCQGVSPLPMLLFSSDFWQVETVADLYKWRRGVQMRTSPQALLESTVGCISGILTGLDCKVWGNLSKLFREFSLAVRVEVGTWASCTGFVLYKRNPRTKMNDCRWANEWLQRVLFSSLHFFLQQWFLKLWYLLDILGVLWKVHGLKKNQAETLLAGNVSW